MSNVSETARLKKVFANRVRRVCKLHGIEIIYDGVPKNYAGVELVKGDAVLFADRSTNGRPLDINWERLYEELIDYGYKCRERKVA
jgi:hypothetical protein|tara:strand:+ start:577 stop:834 length:258 start_codon:yes stop_codon:yes gene_type:complete